MPFATTIANSIIDHYTGKASWTGPAAIWMGLSSTTPTAAGSSVTEPSGGSYARVQVTAAEFDSAASGATTTNADQVFPQATADWVAGADLTHGVFFTASSAGTFIGFGALAQAKPVLNGDTLTVPAGSLDITLA